MSDKDIHIPKKTMSKLVSRWFNKKPNEGTIEVLCVRESKSGDFKAQIRRIAEESQDD